MREKIAIWKARLKELEVQYNIWKAQAEALWRDREVIKTEFRILKAAFPIACKVVAELSTTEFFGPTRTQIAFQRVRYELTLKGFKADEITGGCTFIAVSLAYFYAIKGIGKVA
jgi:hypothetical protein